MRSAKHQKLMCILQNRCSFLGTRLHPRLRQTPNCGVQKFLLNNTLSHAAVNSRKVSDNICDASSWPRQLPSCTERSIITSHAECHKLGNRSYSNDTDLVRRRQQSGLVHLESHWARTTSKYHWISGISSYPLSCVLYQSLSKLLLEDSIFNSIILYHEQESWLRRINELMCINYISDYM